MSGAPDGALSGSTEKYEKPRLAARRAGEELHPVTCSRLESHGEPGQILVSGAVADRLAEEFLF